MNLSDFKVLTFDCYGTLIDWESGMVAGLKPLTDRIAARDGRPLDRNAILEALPGAQVTVHGGGGHFEIHVISEAFEGKRILARQRLVYAAITPLMAGDAAPMHAVDRMVCQTPEQAG